MRDFIYATDKAYENLETLLEDNLCHVFSQCAMPGGCNVAYARIGFEKEERTNGYAVFIDRGITFSGGKAPALFYQWLRTGEIRFLDFDDIKVFFRNLKMIC